MTYASAWPIIRAAAEAFRPPRRIAVSKGAARVLKIRQPGGYSGPWSASETPYMVEPMDTLGSRQHEAVCFVGPARSGKTLSLIEGFLAHAIVHDPGDMLICQMSMEKAREFSKTRIDRAIRHSPEIRARMSARSYDDNTFDKLTKAGMWVKIGWPSATQLASSDYRYTLGTDYDRWSDDIEGEGAGFPLMLKRTQTFLSRGMCMVESSPGREYADPHWKPGTPHEAPPASGIVGIYNRSDRRRWYWQCPDCSEYFEAAPGLRLFATLPDESDLLEIVRGADLTQLAQQHALICCPHCGSVIGPEHKHVLNDLGTARWVADGQTVTRDGEVIGEHPQSSIAGFWLGGVAAAYQRWDSIVLRYLQGLREYALSGSDLTLRTTTNTDQGAPYLPRHLAEATDDHIEARIEDLERFMVPEWSRFLLAAVDVQGGTKARFVVQVHAIGPDMESAIIDRYDITESPRGEDQRIDPAAYPEDWDVLTERVIQSTYRVGDGRELQLLHTVVDYGGEAGVSTQAAGWLRRLRSARLGHRATLGKGDTAIKEAVQRTFARDGAGRRMRDVPLLLINPDPFKNMVAASIRRTEPGPAYMHFPRWLPSSFFDELRAETRLPSGKWKKLRARNEALDLWVYIWALAYALGPADTRRTFPWNNPPPWAAPLDANSHVMTREERKRRQEAPAEAPPPAPTAPAPRPRVVPNRRAFRREW